MCIRDRAVGFDSEINAPGLLVYHVDENRGWGNIGGSFVSVYDDELNKMVDLESADGENDLDNEYNRGDSGDPFPDLQKIGLLIITRLLHQHVIMVWKQALLLQI